MQSSRRIKQCPSKQPSTSVVPHAQPKKTQIISKTASFSFGTGGTGGAASLVQWEPADESYQLQRVDPASGVLSEYCPSSSVKSTPAVMFRVIFITFKLFQLMEEGFDDLPTVWPRMPEKLSFMDGQFAISSHVLNNTAALVVLALFIRFLYRCLNWRNTICCQTCKSKINWSCKLMRLAQELCPILLATRSIILKWDWLDDQIKPIYRFVTIQACITITQTVVAMYVIRLFNWFQLSIRRVLRKCTQINTPQHHNNDATDVDHTYSCFDVATAELFRQVVKMCILLSIASAVLYGWSVNNRIVYVISRLSVWYILIHLTMTIIHLSKLESWIDRNKYSIFATMGLMIMIQLDQQQQ